MGVVAGKVCARLMSTNPAVTNKNESNGESKAGEAMHEEIRKDCVDKPIFDIATAILRANRR